LRYLADKNSAHTHTDRQTHRQTDRHTPLTTIPDGLRRAGKKFHQIIDDYTMYFNNLYHTSFTGRMPFQSPNQQCQCQSIEMKISHASVQAHLGVFCL